ncbi:uncharacterized protein LOC143821057 isoform X2 [Paroedura picta]|uniref:uncharacterized protein LOC143821057 isoform X2 n=1 Tax=Paroedura picta TaxID=143630 RepID=UPI00405651FC
MSTQTEAEKSEPEESEPEEPELEKPGSKIYYCEICKVPCMSAMILQTHFAGMRHKKRKHFPDKGKRKANEPKEDKARFLRRIAREVEKEEGLKMYKVEGYERACDPVAAAKKRARWRGGFKAENDPVLRKKALEYMDFFEISSDAEATQVIRIAQSLSEALKAFCEKKEALKHIRSLPPLMPPRPRNARQQKYNKPYEGFDDDSGDTNWTQELPPNPSPPPQMREWPSSYAGGSSDLATVSALRKSLGPQSGSSAGGISEWMKQFRWSASGDFQSSPNREKSLSSAVGNWGYNDGSSNPMAPAASNNRGWPQSSGYQQPNFQADGKTYQRSFSVGSSYNDYQQQNIQLNSVMVPSPSGLSPNIVNQLRGKDPATLARMLQELVPHYPDLQKVDIYALAHALSKIS